MRFGLFSLSFFLRLVYACRTTLALCRALPNALLSDTTLLAASCRLASIPSPRLRHTACSPIEVKNTVILH